MVHKYNQKFLAVLAKLEGRSKEEVLIEVITAYVESNASVRELLYESGYTEFNY